MTRRGPGRIALVALFAVVLALPAAGSNEPLELRVKAAFLYNFARLATWRPGKFTRADAPLQEALAGKVVNGHAFEVQASAGTDDWQHCHIAYLGAPEAGVLADLAGRGVLTVYEGPVAVPGGVIRLFLSDRKLRFEVNEAAAERAQLHLSSRLMALAAVVRVPGG